MNSVRRLGFAPAALAPKVLAAVALVAAWCSAARAQLPDVLPADAMVVVRVKNLQDVSDKIGMLSQRFGLANARPEFKDPLGNLLTLTGLGPGLDKNGQVVIAVMAPKGPGEPDMVGLVPVADFAAFSASLPNAKPDGAVTSFQGAQGQAMFAANWGKFAAVSPKKEMLANKGTGLKASATAAKELAEKDVVIYANMVVVRQLVLAPFQQNKAMILQQVERGLQQAPNMDPKVAPLLKAYFGQLLNGVERFLTDAEGVTFGINLAKEGISTTLAADFAADSYLGKTFKALKPTDASFTAGLPEGKYFVYGGIDLDAETEARLIADFLAPIEKEMQALGNDGAPMVATLQAAKEFMGAATQMSFGMIAPPGQAIGREQGVLQSVSVIRGDTAKMQQAMKKILDNQEALTKSMGAAAMGAKTAVAPAAKTVDGVKLDRITTTYEGQPQTPQEQQMAYFLKVLFGPKGMVQYSGVVDAQKMISTSGVPEETVAAAISAAKTNADPLGKGPAAAVSKALPQNRVAAFYVAVDQIATTVLDVMAAQGMRGGVKIPENLPPLGFTVATEGSAVRIDGYYPTKTVESLISAGMQMFLQNMQGGGAGGNQGL